MRRKPNIPAIFLTALALGMWVGASWHSASQPLALAQSGANCKTCCRFPSVLAKQFKTVQIAASAGADTSACAACLAGALVYDAPSVSPNIVAEMSAPNDTAPVLESAQLSAHTHSHPPERGPPA